MDRFELVEKLLKGSLTPEEATASGIEIRSQGADPDVDSGSAVLGSSEALFRFVDLYYSSEVEELEEPEPGCIALYVDADADVVHYGRVSSSLDGSLVIVSKISGSSFIIAHPVDLPPTDVPGDLEVIWAVEP